MKYQTCELSKINIDIKYLLPTSTVDPTSHPFLKNVKKNCITFIWNWCFNQVVDQSLCRVCRSIEQGSVALRNSIRWRYFLNFFLQDLRRHIQNICQEHTSPNYMIKAWTNVESFNLNVPCWALLTFENICKLCDIDLSFSVIKYSTKFLNGRQIKREEQAIEQTWYFDFACNVVRVLNKLLCF